MSTTKEVCLYLGTGMLVVTNGALALDIVVLTTPFDRRSFALINLGLCGLVIYGLIPDTSDKKNV